MPLVALAFPTPVDGSVGRHDESVGVPGDAVVAVLVTSFPSGA